MRRPTSGRAVQEPLRKGEVDDHWAVGRTRVERVERTARDDTQAVDVEILSVDAERRQAT